MDAFKKGPLNLQRPILSNYNSVIMKYLIQLLVLGFLFFVNSISLSAQKPATPKDSIWVLETRDGNTYMGTIQKNRDTTLINTKFGLLKIPNSNIKSLEPSSMAGTMVQGEFWQANNYATRHFWGPSGYGLKKGQGYYQNTWVLMNQVSYGFTNNFTLGLGVIPTFLFGAREYIPFWLTPKFSIPYKNGKGAFGFGTILFGLLGGDVNEGIGILYGANTFGTPDKQLTLGLGYGYSTEGGLAEYPTISLSAQRRFSKRWVFLTENYMLAVGNDAGLFGFISAGARYMGKTVALDFGGIVPYGGDIDLLIAVPWLGITVPFK